MSLNHPNFEQTRSVDPEQPKRYAAASGDYNPIHLDAEFARAVGLPGIILHGLCTMAFLAEHAAAAAGSPEALRRLKLRFSQPVQPGDTLQIRSEPMGDPQQDLQRIKIRCRNQEGLEIVSGAQADIALSPKAGLPITAWPNPAEEPIQSQPFRLEEAAVSTYVQAVGDPWPGYQEGFVPPLYAAVFAMEPFVSLLKIDPEELLSKNIKILHGGQEFEFTRLLKVGETVRTRGAVERRAQKSGFEFLYFITETRDEAEQPVCFGRWLAVLQGHPKSEPPA